MDSRCSLPGTAVQMKAKAASLFTIVHIVGILGPRGSGVYWLRHMVEQMTGIYTGSPYNEYPHIFKAEGDTKEVAMSENVWNSFSCSMLHVKLATPFGRLPPFCGQEILVFWSQKRNFWSSFCVPVFCFCLPVFSDRLVVNLQWINL